MGLFSKLFGSRAADMPPLELAVVGVDMHSHFIPGIDDGAPTLEAAVELVRAMHELGYRKVITTPHVMADGYRNTPARIRAGLDELRRGVAEAGIPVEVEAAAEYYLDHELEGKVNGREVLTFGDRLVLFELPFISEPAILLNVVFAMQTQGYQPVLAHPERYGFWYADSSTPAKLKERGVLFQLNLIALMGAYGVQARKAAEKYIDLGWYELVGTDCHRMDHIEAVKATLREPYLHKLIGSGRLLNPAL